MQAVLGCFHLGMKLHTWVCVCVSLCAHWTPGTERMELQDGSGQSSDRPWLLAPLLPRTWWCTLDCCSLKSDCQLSTSVLPSHGGKQPVPVGLLWIQQTAFYFSQLGNAAESNRVGRWLLPGKEAMILEHSDRARQWGSALGHLREEHTTCPDSSRSTHGCIPMQLTGRTEQRQICDICQTFDS